MIKKFIRRLLALGNYVGIDLRRAANLIFLPSVLCDLYKWMSFGGKVNGFALHFADKRARAGSFPEHYFQQDLLVANRIFLCQPRRHVDIGSRMDGFAAHVASFREIEVLDIREFDHSIQNIKFVKADLMNEVPQVLTDSLSCLHAIEHFGLGRYGDLIDPLGHEHGLANIVQMLEPKGRLYLSAPIGEVDRVVFNAHRVFAPDTLPNLCRSKFGLELINFDFIDDDGVLTTETSLDRVSNVVHYGLGIYTFERN